MIQFKESNYTEDQINLMRDWAKDCTWADDQDNEFIDELSDIEVLKGIEKNYEGGLAAFMQTVG